MDNNTNTTNTDRRRRIMLINPPTGLYRRDDRCQSKVDDQTVRVVFAPVDLALLGAIARQAGAEPKVCDYPALNQSEGVFIADIKTFRPHILFLNSTVHTLAKDMELVAKARDFDPGILTLLHGEGVVVQAEKVLRDYPQCDAILDGEPELTLREIVTTVPDEQTLWQTPGLVCRDGSGTPFRTGKRPLIESLDILPLPARDLLNNKIYHSPENGKPLTVIQAQRGCPSKCVFCPAGSMFGYVVRERSVESIMAELKECVEKYGITNFLFHGDTFTLHKPWLLKLCDAIINSGMKIHWGCNSRIDTIDDERAAALKKAGCWVVAFGFEHGNQNMLNLMRKGQRAERAFEAVSICKRNGLLTHGFFIAGLPWETKRTLQQLYLYARKLNTDFFDFNIACPLPGTELYNICLQEQLFVHTDSSSYAHAGVRTLSLSAEELTEWRRKTLLKMYFRPTYVARIIIHAIKTGTIKHYLAAALSRVKILVKTT